MTEIIIPIPARLKNVAQGGHVAGSEDIDAGGNKNQKQVNDDMNLGIQIINDKIGTMSGNKTINERLDDLEAAESITYEGGEAQIAQGSDFTNPDATKRAKIPTVGAIVDGLNDGVYDVSKRNPTAGPNSDGKFTLDYILNNANTLIPTGWRHGGMTISFVDSSDNKYVQFRLMKNTWSATETDWQGVDKVPTTGSMNLVESGGVYDVTTYNRYLAESAFNSYNFTDVDSVETNVEFSKTYNVTIDRSKAIYFSIKALDGADFGNYVNIAVYDEHNERIEGVITIQIGREYGSASLPWVGNASRIFVKILSDSIVSGGSIEFKVTAVDQGIIFQDEKVDTPAFGVEGVVTSDGIMKSLNSLQYAAFKGMAVIKYEDSDNIVVGTTFKKHYGFSIDRSKDLKLQLKTSDGGAVYGNIYCLIYDKDGNRISPSTPITINLNTVYNKDTLPWDGNAAYFYIQIEGNAITSSGKINVYYEAYNADAFDSTPQKNSSKLVNSNTVYGALETNKNFVYKDVNAVFYNNHDNAGRVRAIYKVNKGDVFTALKSTSPGICANLHLTIKDAEDGTNVAQNWNSGAYTTNAITGTCNYDGYLSIGFKNASGSKITNVEAQTLFSQFTIKMQHDTPVNETTNLIHKTKSDFSFYRVDTNGSESASGTRISCVLPIANNGAIKTSIVDGKGVYVGVSDTLTNAKKGVFSEDITKNYVASYNGKFGNGNFLVIRLCKEDGSSFSDEELSSYIEDVNIEVEIFKNLIQMYDSLSDGQKEEFDNNISPREVPGYWEEYLIAKKATINNYDVELGRNGVSFAFISDIHVDTNYGNSPKILKWITKNSNIKQIICGGDILYDDVNDTSKNTKANAIKQITWWKNATNGLDIVNIRGNHDSNQEYATGQTVSLDDFYALMNRQSEDNVCYEPNALYGYRDNKNQKVRFIYLNGATPHSQVISDTQINWMKEKILELQSGWTVVIFVHGLWVVADKSQHLIEDNDDRTKIVTALDSIYDEADATIAAVISGHAHVDYDETSAKGYKLISTTCDTGGWNASWFDWNYPTRTEGTTTEQCFDLFYIDTENRTIKTLRIGAGDTVGNRTFSY